ncbi:MAG: hypothetical protein ACREJB_05500, partial [Planctomycetaceae bacterium]
MSLGIGRPLDVQIQAVQQTHASACDGAAVAIDHVHIERELFRIRPLFPIAVRLRGERERSPRQKDCGQSGDNATTAGHDRLPSPRDQGRVLRSCVDRRGRSDGLPHFTLGEPQPEAPARDEGSRNHSVLRWRFR